MNRNRRIVFISLVILTVLAFATLAFADKKCPKCNKVYPDEANYCGQCEEGGKPIKLVPLEKPKPRAKPKAKAKPKARPKMTYIGENSKGYKEYRWNKDGSTMILIPAGEFWMGSPPGEGNDDEHPQHKVYLDGYYIDKYEVTNEQFDSFVRATGHKTDAEKEGKGWVYDDKWVEKSGATWRTYYYAGKEKHPVVLVSWKDATAYCQWAGKKLPTEAKWEKAARGVDGREYPWGNREPDAGGLYRCNCGEGTDRAVWRRDGYEFTSPVGTYERGTSPYGLHDMAGNVWEWCSDWYDKNYYGRSPSRNPKRPASGENRVVRGGSWFRRARNVRCANRSYTPSYWSLASTGVRCSSSP